MSANPAKETPLGAAVRRLRYEKGVTQEALAFEANVTIATLSRIERGVTSPAWHTLKQIASALHITPVELVAAAERERAQHTEAEQQASGEPDDLLAQGARGVREREGERQAEVRQALEAYARRRAVDRDTRIIAELAPLIDRAKAAGLSMDEVGRLAEGKANRAPVGLGPTGKPSMTLDEVEANLMGDDA